MSSPVPAAAVAAEGLLEFPDGLFEESNVLLSVSDLGFAGSDRVLVRGGASHRLETGDDLALLRNAGLKVRDLALVLLASPTSSALAFRKGVLREPYRHVEGAFDRRLEARSSPRRVEELVYEPFRAR